MFKQIFGLVVFAILLSGFYGQPVRYPELDPAKSLTFPRDHFAHHEFRTEWWYFNGFLAESDTNLYAFHAAFFVRRTEIDFYKQLLPIRWLSNPVHLAHFALIDLATGEKLVAEKRSRDARQFRGRAGASEERAQVWNDGWRYWEDDEGIKLHIAEQEFELSMVLGETKPIVLHGDRGSFVKAEYHGKPRGSYYVSRPRLHGTGIVGRHGEQHKLTVEAWMDHEFGSYHLSPDQSGWNWFSIMLDDGSELVLYLLKNLDGTANRFSKGTWINPQGVTETIDFEDIRAAPVATWRSLESGANYPIRWQVQIPSLSLDMTIEAPIENLEFDSEQSTMVTYWEGPVTARGKVGDTPVAGVGFLELTGNTEPLQALSQ